MSWGKWVRGDESEEADAWAGAIVLAQVLLVQLKKPKPEK